MSPIVRDMRHPGFVVGVREKGICKDKSKGKDNRRSFVSLRMTRRWGVSGFGTTEVVP